MKYTTMTIAALAVLVAACEPEAPDAERTASTTETGQPAADDTRTNQEPAADSASDVGRTPAQSADGQPTESGLVGKIVVGSDGRLLGTSQRIVREPKSEEKLAVISVSGDTGETREVVVPAAELKPSAIPGKLELQMTAEQLAEQPDADSAEYVDVERWIRDTTEEPATTSGPKLSSTGSDTK